ncbi:MAG: OpgC domain-containing protein [Alphaproteobacteria bacterium]|nr:MAG: OpgC domain-containing protein [Alphaproteobacteria bacterium]
MRLDLFRGLALLFIFIDHIPNNVLSYVTLHSIAFSDAAEVFIFISGYAAATVYGRALQRQGGVAATGQICRRIWQLYVAHIFIFVILAAEVCYATLSLHQTYSEDFGIDNFIDEPQVAIIKVLLLQYQPQFLDILPIYMILLGVFPVVLLLLQRCLPLPLILSGALYLLTLRFGWQPHSYPDNEAWFFNPLAWQFLFVIGATAGYSQHSRWVFPGQGSWLPKLAIAITVAIGIVSISWTIHGAYDAFPGLLSRELSPLVADKSNLAPLRLISFLALAVTVAHFVGRDSGVLRWRVAQLIIRCGQHSLQVFCLGIVLSVLGYILLTFFRDNILTQLAIDLAGIVAMMGIAVLLTWYKANNATNADAVIAASANFEIQRRSIAGIERHVIVWIQDLGRLWARSKRPRTEVRWRSQPYPMS